ncbi:MAG: chemotaxis protein CheW [Planctomycetaceae bacterium]
MSVASDRGDSISRRKDSAQFVGFRLDQQSYVFPIGQIQEIVIPDKVTKMPQVADYVEGVSNLRGTIIPIINLRRLLGLSIRPTDDETRTIVVNVGERTMGCTVDAVSQVMRISADSIQPAADLVAGEATPWISGFAKLNDELLIVLDINELLDPEKLSRVQQTSQAVSGAPTPQPDAQKPDAQTHITESRTS